MHAYASIRELSDALRTGAVSPRHLVDDCLDRLETLGPTYNAVVTVTRPRAETQAQRVEQEIAAGCYRGPLHGVPYGAKDLLATTSDIPTTWGATPFRRQTFDYDAAVIVRLERDGAVLAAKLAMVELAGGMGYRQPNASFSGPCRNPWNPDTWSGGSSSGSGAAVSAGLIPFAIGSETWGSILRPANNCGVSGLRPTYGLVSRHGAMALSWTLDKLGPLCRTADDCGLVLEAIAGVDPRDPSTRRAFTYDADLSGPFRIAVLHDGVANLHPAVRRNFEATLCVLGRCAVIEEIAFPDRPYEAMTRTILYAESASAFEAFIASGKASELTAPEDRYGPYARTVVLATDYLKALRLRGVVARDVEAILRPYDALVAPTSRTAATPIDQAFRGVTPTTRDVVGAIGNGVGLPAISIPNGFTEVGLPTGVQLVGRAYGENRILAVARDYQSRTDWHLRRPPANLTR
jgi:aspartyl-tRNA(Asn)/glutamyl-tRNA(Gln) amidotransferase subunit A